MTAAPRCGRTTRQLSLLMLALALGWACGTKPKSKVNGQDADRSTKGSLQPSKGKKKAPGLAFSLADGAPPNRKLERAKQVKGTALDSAQTARLLARLPAIKRARTKAFALRASTLAAPRPGKTITAAFPPAPIVGKPPATATSPLEVLRATPSGDVGLAPRLSVTFSHPMIAVSSQQDAARNVPVKLTPAVEGKWAWLGTRTIVFQPKPRFAMATAYEATIPATTKAASGATLKTDYRFSFSTPPLRLTGHYPAGSRQRRDVVLFLRFDQRIDPKAVLDHVELRGGGEKHALVLVPDAAAMQHEALVSMIEDARRRHPKRYLVARPQRLLDPDTSYTVTLQAGTPSAEGPIKTKTAQTFSFRTYAPLRVTYHNCDRYTCPPGNWLNVQFNNRIDPDRLDPKTIRVEPKLPRMRVTTSYRSLGVTGLTRGQTTYKLTLPASLTDVHGQKLGKKQTISFRFGPAHKRLESPGQFFRVLDPAGEPTLRLYSVNHKEVDVELYRVKPEDYGDAASYRSSVRSLLPKSPPGKLVSNKVLRLQGDKDARVETYISLKPALKGGKGMVLAVVKQKPLPIKPWSRQIVVAWLQVGRIAVDAFDDGDNLVAWVTRLDTGAPVKGATVTLGAVRASTDAGGLARLPLPTSRQPLLVARSGDDVAMLPHDFWSASSGWRRYSRAKKRFAWVVFDDRKLYKPKQQVRVKGWLRVLDMTPKGGVVGLPAPVRALSYQVIGPRGNKVAQGHAQLGRLGGFDLEFRLPDNVNLGRARVVLRLANAAGIAGGYYTHSFRIQEFRRPEFEVSTRVSQGPHFLGGHGVFTAEAKYLSGGGLAGATVNWRVSSRRGSYYPPNNAGFTFVGWRPLWWGGQQRFPSVYKSFSGVTDGRGVHRMQVNLEQLDPPVPAVVQATAVVQDINRQALTSSSQLIVHPSSAYVGLRTKKWFVKSGEPLEVDIVVAGIDGKRIAGRAVELSARRVERYWDHGKLQTKNHPPVFCRETSQAKPVTCRLQLKEGGTYLVVGKTKDSDGRPASTEMMRWVVGGAGGPVSRRVERESARLIADKKQYRSGETAEILVQSPFKDAYGVLTLLRGGELSSRSFKLKGYATTLKVPIEGYFVPNIQVRVELVGRATRRKRDGTTDTRLPTRPAYAGGSLTLSVPPVKQTLQVEVKPREKQAVPGQSTQIAVAVKDEKGNPVAGAAVALLAVDESVLMLTGYRFLDPITRLYPHRWGQWATRFTRNAVQLVDPQLLQPPAPEEDGVPASTAGAPGGAPPTPQKSMRGRRSGGRFKRKMARTERAKKDASGADPKIKVRTDFRALALYAPRLVTNQSGQVTVPFKLPDSLTRYRVVALVLAGNTQAGKGESQLVARQPLMIRPSPPRFLNFGDRAELPFVLQNQTAQTLQVKVALRASNAAFLASIESGETTGGAVGRSLSIPANQRVEIRFPITPIGVGTARFQLAAAAGSHADAASVSLPVWTPATTEAFATYGTVDKGAIAQPVALPKGVIKQFGGIEITTSSTALQALTDAVLYLVAYPYECSEQLSSRVLAVAALKDVLAAFKAPGLPSVDKIMVAVARDIKRLRGMQNGDGGFPIWVRGRPSWPFHSVHVMHALARALQKRFTVPGAMIASGKRYLQQIRQHFPYYYSEAYRRIIESYALYTRQLLGDRDVVRAATLLDEELGKSKPNLELVGWLYPVIAGQASQRARLARVRKLLRNRVTETAAGAHFVTSYSDGAHLILHSSRRVDGLLLEGLIGDQPKSDLIVKIVRGLLGHRKRGRWGSTQENAWVLIGLDRYFRTYEKLTPNFVARAWLGQRFAGEHAFRGRTKERHLIKIPMAYLADRMGGKAPLVLQKRGPGRMYYRIGMRYAPADLKPPPAEYGFTVTRRYEAVDKPTDVKRLADGSWSIKAGARVRVRINMVAPTRRYHVALVDPLPAGLEPLNPALRGSDVGGASRVRRRGGRRHRGGYRGRYPRRAPWFWRRWSSRWFEHQNLRDERAEAFSSLVWGGTHEYTYLARATTPGRFVAPPPKAEEMYHPETFGRGPGDIVVVR